MKNKDVETTANIVVDVCRCAIRASDVNMPEIVKRCKSALNGKTYSEKFNPYKVESDLHNEFETEYKKITK